MKRVKAAPIGLKMGPNLGFAWILLSDSTAWTQDETLNAEDINQPVFVLDYCWETSLEEYWSSSTSSSDVRIDLASSVSALIQ